MGLLYYDPSETTEAVVAVNLPSEKVKEIEEVLLKVEREMITMMAQREMK